MSYITQPINSMVRLSPYSQRLLQYGTSDSRVYLSKATNSLLNPFVLGYSDHVPPKDQFPTAKYDYIDRTSVIVDGCNSTYEINNGELVVTISPGQVICDTTLLIFPQETILSVELDQISHTSDFTRVILSVNFQWLETLYEQPPRLRLMLLDPSDTFTYGPDDWETRLDRLVINVFDVDKSTNNVTSYNPKPTKKYNHQWISIKGLPYEVGPNISFLDNFADFTEDRYVRKQVTYTRKCINPEGLDENQIILPITYYPKDAPSTVGLQFIIEYDPTKLSAKEFVSSTQLNDLNKTITTYIDYEDGQENGRVQIQIGDTSLTKLSIPMMSLGDIIFSFLEGATYDSTLNLNVVNIVATYSNTTTENLSIYPRIDPIEKTEEFLPINATAYQPAIVNYGKVNLSNAVKLNFSINGVQDSFEITDPVLAVINTNKTYMINNTLKLYINSSSHLCLEALNSLTTFSEAFITTTDDTNYKIHFQLDSASVNNAWIISNPNYYWVMNPNDQITIKFNEINDISIILTDNDIEELEQKSGIWTTIPSNVSPIVQAQYNLVDSTAKISFKVMEEYSSQYTISGIELICSIGSGITNFSPRMMSYRRNTNIFDPTHFHLNAGDVFKYTTTSITTPKEFVLTSDIIYIIKNTTYGYKSEDFRIYFSTDNYMIVEPIIYNETLTTISLIDRYIDNNEPATSGCLWFKTQFKSTRPTFGLEDLDRTKNYSTCWTYGDLNHLSGGERDFYTIIDVSNLNKSHYSVQCYQDGFVINPMAIQFVDSNSIKIWMPESFVFKLEIPQLEVVIIG